MQPINQITRKQLAEWEQEGRVFRLIDVREVWEREEFHIGGTLLPFSEFSVADYEFEEGIPVVIYCARGVRSTLVIQRLSWRMDCSHFYNLTGGVKGDAANH